MGKALAVQLQTLGFSAIALHFEGLCGLFVVGGGFSGLDEFGVIGGIDGGVDFEEKLLGVEGGSFGRWGEDFVGDFENGNLERKKIIC